MGKCPDPFCSSLATPRPPIAYNGGGRRGGVLLLALVALARPAWGADATLAGFSTPSSPPPSSLSSRTYCVTCHGGDKPEAGLTGLVFLPFGGGE